MKKVVSCLLVLVLCLSATVTALAETVDFVPSITYKPAPDVIATVPEGHEGCIVVTPVSAADDTMELTELYQALTADGVKLSEVCADLNATVEAALGENKTADNLVVRDLFHMASECEDLAAYMDANGAAKVTFASTVAADEAVFAMMYVDGAWKPIEAVNNNDGSITISVKEWGPVAIMVPASADSDNTQTGESSDTVLWVTVMGVALVAMVVSVVVYRRRSTAK